MEDSRRHVYILDTKNHENANIYIECLSER